MTVLRSRLPLVGPGLGLWWPEACWFHLSRAEDS